MNTRSLFKYKFRPFALEQWILLSCLFSICLLLARILFTGYLTYLFLVWNLFLGLVPFLITRRISVKISMIEKRWKLIVLTIVWILFIPNSFYIVTDLFHLKEFDAAPKWFDLLLIFSFAWNGLLFGVISIRRMELIIALAGGSGFSTLFIGVVMWLNAFGIYIGRYLRYNSWDIITQPFTLFGELLTMIIHPFRFHMEWGMVTIYAFFILLLYGTMKRIGEQFQQTIK